MNQKICSMCRKSVDHAALICPHCTSKIEYQYFMDVHEDTIDKKRTPLFNALSFIVSAIIIGIVGIFGIVIAGFWVGIGIVMFTGMIVAAISNAMRAEGYDCAKITCPGCGHESEHRWDAGDLDYGKQATFDCSSCKKTTRITISQHTL